MTLKNPIAIIGISSLLPKANDPTALWDNVMHSRICLREATTQDWRIDPHLFQTLSPDKVNSIMGGFIDGFDTLFSHLSLSMDKEIWSQLDPVFQFTLYTAYQALIDAKLSPEEMHHLKSGLILGNLSYPTSSLNQLCEQTCFARQNNAIFEELLKTKINPLNRFMSGLPAQLTAKLLNIKGDVFAIDAACASALYAMKLACDRLLHHQADVILAGAVNAADDLFIHMGFTALQALSTTGQSLPFHSKANGLIPSQGAGFVVLKRLEDAIRDHNHIYGIIRGIGLANDGNSKGFLAPSAEGQVRAMRLAYELSGLHPDDIDYVECHATGTQVGDKVELASMRQLFSKPLFISALKANIGHSITVSTHAALIKVLHAFKQNTLPPSYVGGDIIAEANTSPFTLLTNALPWPNHSPHRAAINGFGFGGCNAHAIFEAWENQGIQQKIYFNKSTKDPIAITAIGIVADGYQDKDELYKAVLKPRQVNQAGKNTNISLNYEEARFPPTDLEQTLGQQLLILKAAAAALKELPEHSQQNTGVYVGMQCDPDIARYSIRWRLPFLLKDSLSKANHASLQKELDELIPKLTAARAIGAMPNIVANRINLQYDFQGPSFAVSSEALSGIDALQQAMMDLRSGDIKRALVGAVDICYEEVQQFAAEHIKLPLIPSDAAVVLILEKKEDAEKLNHPIYALIDDLIHPEEKTWDDELITETIGYSHCANGLLNVALASLCCSYGAWPNRSDEPYPWENTSGTRSVCVPFETYDGRKKEIHLTNHSATPVQKPCYPLPYLYLMEGKALSEWIGREMGETSRLVIRTENQQHLKQQLATAKELLSHSPSSIATQGIFYQSQAVTGKIAFVFTAAHTSYEGMGRDVVLAYPHLRKALAAYFPFQERILETLYQTENKGEWSLFDELILYSYLSQFHYLLLSNVLGLKSDAMIGFCSGETNALFADGSWRDMTAMLNEIESSGIYTRYLADLFEVMQIPNETWEVYHVLYPIVDTQKILNQFPNCYVTVINTDHYCVIAGPKTTIEKAIQAFPPGHVKKAQYNMIIHCELVNRIRDIWYQIHNRKTVSVSIPHYSAASHQAYYPDQTSAAEALLKQAIGTVNFPQVIKQAWDDGIRIFIECGPRNLCTHSINEILKDKPHLAASLDITHASSGLSFASLCGLLLCNAIPINYPHIITEEPFSSKEKNAKSYATHWPTIHFHLDQHEKVSAETLDVMQIIAQSHEHITQYRMQALHEFKHFSQEILSRVHQYQSSPSKQKEAIFSRAELEIHASGLISSIFGDAFKAQDQYRHQVRMPEPPLLLADRVTKLEAKAASMECGTVWTETDVTNHAWYLHDNHMPAGIMIESGQADLFLISYLGVDLLNKGKRVYRLLGCELTYYGGLPQVGDTLCYEIHVDGHAEHGDIRIFFFHYDCMIGNKKRLVVRHGQAGFFTEEELANTKGIIWDAKEATCKPDATLDPSLVTLQKNSFNETEIKAFAAGNMFECFGTGFTFASTHNNSPRIPNDKMLLFKEVLAFNPKGGPWQRGYCKATLDIEKEAWFFKGHFKNDSCMPGTLMFEGCLQVMAFYMTALGFALDKDGWRFEPVPGVPYTLQCRSQVTPTSKQITYELFIEEQITGPVPQLFADVLVSVDGIKAFHGRRIGLQLTKDYPLSRHTELLKIPDALSSLVSVQQDGFKYDYASMLNFAWGKPSNALGKLYEPFDQGLRVARMPGPPYNFMHAVSQLHGSPNNMKPGGEVTIAYVVPNDAWYFAQSEDGKMPFCVLIEIALQPCGWLASYVGCPLHSQKILCFRNLDGTGQLTTMPTKGSGTIYTHTKLKELSHYGDTFILSFEVICQLKNEVIYQMKTSFGFFPTEAFINQPGLSVTTDEEANLAKSSSFTLDLHHHQQDLQPSLFPPKPMLLMIDNITGFWPEGGISGKGQLRAEKKVNPNEWFFKAHFYLDPVQPGSLGLQAMIQLLQFYLLKQGYHLQMKHPAWLPPNISSWKYRGQVTPENKKIIIMMDIIELEMTEDRVYAKADASLWVDGKKIYAAKGVSTGIYDK